MATEEESTLGKRVLVTGGAGFIGSHLVDKLMQTGNVTRIFDNLSYGSLDNIKRWTSIHGFEFVKGDLLEKQSTEKAVADCEAIFHLAANPEVRLSSISPDIHFEQNVVATYNLLEAVRKSSVIESFVFTSSSTVYGDASVIPTPEDYTPLEPISIYGASKLASEALITAYAHTYGFSAVIYRLANIIGSRSGHGVIHDFIKKLHSNPKELEILGDGTQSKSYLHVSDCVEAMLFGYAKAGRHIEVYNLGSDDRINVGSIARIVVEEMSLKGVSFYYTGGVDGGKGWKGDVKFMLLAVGKIESLGWKPKMNSAEAVTKAVKELMKIET